jgi:hypothetical protein
LTRTTIALRACAILLAASFVNPAAAADQTGQKPKPKPRPAPAQKSAPAAPPEKAPAVPQQWKATSRYVAGGQESIITVYASGPRQRVELGSGNALITQCDQGKTVQISDKARAYVVSTLGAAPPATQEDAARKPGGVIVVRTVATDTGERRELLGQQARRVKIVTATEPDPQACDKRKTRAEIDGWYANVPELHECPAAKATGGSDAAGNCADERKTEVSGEASPGYPLAYTLVVFDDAGKEVSRLAVEVTSLTREPQSQALFEPPADFSALADAGALAAAARRAELEELGTTPKPTGLVRIGVTVPADRSGRSVSSDVMESELLEAFNEKPFEAVPIAAETPEEQHGEARKKECDFVLRAELASLTTSKAGRVGGLMRRASGGGSPVELHEAKVNVELFAVGENVLLKKQAASAKTGSFTWRRAAGLARFAGRLYFGVSGGLMRTLMTSMGGSSGALLGADPTLSVLTTLLANNEAAGDESTPESAVAAALDRGAADIIKNWQKK